MGRTGGAAAEPLLERERALAELERAVASAAAGEGALALVVGPAGIGKTSLLGAARGMAQRHGMRTLAARGVELEQAFAFGVARQLLEEPLRRASEEERRALLAGAASLSAWLLAPAGADPAAPGAEGLFPRLHGLHWLVAELAARQPLLLAVDDAHAADPESLRWLAFLARRLRGLPVALVVAWRTGEAADPVELLAADEAATSVVEPAPLSRRGVERVLAGRLGGEPSATLVDECRRATGGNPFLVSELAAELRAAGGERDAPGPLAPAAVGRWVQRRLRRLGAPAERLAATVATLESCPLGLAAELSELEPEAAAAAADALRGADMLAPGRPLRFAHPLVRQAVRDLTPPHQRARAHARAARALARAGADAEHVAAQLLAAEPMGDAWAARVLAEAGEAAAREGAAETAERLLARALEEPPADADRARVLRALGRVESSLRRDSARAHLAQARDCAGDPRLRAEIARELAQDLYLSEDVLAAVRELDAAIGGLGEGDRDLALVLEAQLAGFCLADERTLRVARARGPRLAAAEDADGPGARMALVQLAYADAMAGRARDRVVARVRRAMEGGLLGDVGPEAQLFQFAVSALAAAGELEEARRWSTAGIEAARATGSIAGYAFCSCFRARIWLQLGALADAEADARSALDPTAAASRIAGTATAFLVCTLVEQGRLADAADALDACPVDPGRADSFPLCNLRLARGLLRSARGEPSAALDDLRGAGRAFTRWGVRNPALAPWRAPAALALAAVGEPAAARALAAEEVRRSRSFGSARPLAAALCAAGLLEGGDAGAAQLREALALLDGTPARGERARVLVELGAMLRRLGRRGEAKRPLAEGLDLAHRCGAAPLEARAREELLALGSRPRRALLRGVESLTAQERRVARMAADGMTNRAIAQALFVTLSTVEAHLGRAYRKLGISSRAELPAALDDAIVG